MSHATLRHLEEVLLTPGSLPNGQSRLPQTIKHSLRKILLAERKAQYAQKGASDSWGKTQVERALQGLGLSLDDTRHPAAFGIACYFPIRQELDLAACSSPHWIFPRIQGVRQMTWFERGDGAHLVANPYGILEAPASFTQVYDPTTQPPLFVFVPCLAATPEGIRLGYGGGFYDTFLAENKDHVVSVACLPAGFLFDTLPCEAHDVTVDIVVTPTDFFCSTNAGSLRRRLCLR